MAAFAEKENPVSPRQRTASHLSIAMAKIHELRTELLDHPPYSPDLGPSNFFLLPHLKIAFGRQRFSSNEEAITFVNNYFAEKIWSTIYTGYTEMGASLGEVCRVTRRLC
ncbi:histone-lysine N-methyltransferase SETMAR [Trichonephila clavipes]|nr:histone-lysine N-methyltransferase SETMAR [Trichonephila clavipes]